MATLNTFIYLTATSTPTTIQKEGIVAFPGNKKLKRTRHNVAVHVHKATASILKVTFLVLVIFGVFLVVNMNTAILWSVTPSSLVGK
jgi:uncharacterized integral membrane protein